MSSVILTDRNKSRRNDPEWDKNLDVRLSPESIANVCLFVFDSAQTENACSLISTLHAKTVLPGHGNWTVCYYVFSVLVTDDL